MNLEPPDVCPTIGSVDEGILALWASVLERAVQDVAAGIRAGILLADLTATDKRDWRDVSEPRTALMFLRSREGEELCELVSAAGRGGICCRFLLKRAVDIAAIPRPDAWKNRARLVLTEAERAERAMRTRAYQQVYQRERKSKRRAAALETPANPEQKECA